MATQRVRPADYTGRQRQKLQAQHAEQMAARSSELAMSAEAQQALSDEVTDVTREAPEPVEGPDGVVSYVEPPSRTIRVNSTIENMTFGIGNNYTFNEGQQYKVPALLADHLEELGYVWH